MYLPSQFEEPRVDVMHALIRAHPLAAIVIHGPAGLVANHVPLRVAPEPATFGTLRGHVARANPLWRELQDGVEALAIFQGPQGYITPSFYPTKRDTGKVVPTWNYAVVHAHGRLRAIDDPAWLRAFLEGLTAQQESLRETPWHVSDAPDDFVAMQLRAIVGIELAVTRMVGKWKVSQNRTPADREGVIEGLRAEGTERALAMADLVERAARGS